MGNANWEYYSTKQAEEKKKQMGYVRPLPFALHARRKNTGNRDDSSRILRATSGKTANRLSSKEGEKRVGSEVMDRKVQSSQAREQARKAKAKADAKAAAIREAVRAQMAAEDEQDLVKRAAKKKAEVAKGGNSQEKAERAERQAAMNDIAEALRYGQEVAAQAEAQAQAQAAEAPATEGWARFRGQEAGRNAREGNPEPQDNSSTEWGSSGVSGLPPRAALQDSSTPVNLMDDEAERLDKIKELEERRKRLEQEMKGLL
ncbi:hypothetical protein CYMTET_28033 [Cymbomonas tetramitiformis]|uniref:Uncharacterized protein n=1 Tax=Cymbomonas tetramitiformis TaxID=36881 RepID=A0AAE0FP68_9CHLO|nr:hypothetical protein CYMTET_28033 [Cymbomonas tetramitiformis]